MVSGPSSEALDSLSPSQIAFLQSLPKAELHAHLNGSIPVAVLQDLAREHIATNASLPSEVQAGLTELQNGVELNEIHQFFGLFPAVYALTSTAPALARVTRAVLHEFLEGENPQCAYIELRTTPRQTGSLTRQEYLQVVLSEIERYPASQAALIVSLDRRMADNIARECVEIAIQLKASGRRVVGIDLCGDPMAGDMAQFLKHIQAAKAAGLGVTLHIAETALNPESETLQLLSAEPDRLGHATFLNEASKEIVKQQNTCIEICLSSNLLCKTVKTLDDHHIRYYLQHNHPIAICTDDILPFRNSMLGEYALLMAQPPLGLGLSEAEIRQVAKMSMECRFGAP